MNFDLPTILVMLVASAVGFVYLSYGKKMGELRFMIFGAALLFYGYFFDSMAAQIGVGAVLAIAPYIWGRFV